MFPGAGAYQLNIEKTWNEQKLAREVRPSWAKSPRHSEADILALNALKPEKCTPSPNDYKVNKSYVLPSVGKVSLVQA
jgi:hypothetical protein